ncbi:MAG: BrnT family toxin [Candidatus Binatia bacterium]
MYEWDPKKATANLVKHGVSFEEARTAFDDVNGLDGEDIAHSEIERRRLRLARSSAGRILLVAYTKRRRWHEDITRIISARQASRKERNRYEAPED